MARAVVLVSLVVGAAVGTTLAVARWWPQRHVEPYTRRGAAGAKGKKARNRARAPSPAADALLIPQQQRAG